MIFHTAEGEFQINRYGTICHEENGFTSIGAREENSIGAREEKMAHEMKFVLEKMLEDYRTGKSFADWLES